MLSPRRCHTSDVGCAFVEHSTLVRGWYGDCQQAKVGGSSRTRKSAIAGSASQRWAMEKKADLGCEGRAQDERSLSELT
jgi:hypothetical protein